MTDTRRLFTALAAVLALGWAGLLVAGPWVASGAPAVGAWLYAAGSLICHQQPERSFHLAGAQLPVCARCLGLYAGAALGLTGWALAPRRVPRAAGTAVAALAVTGAPTLVTVLAAWLGLGDPSNAWRAVLAAPLGAAGGWVVGAVITDHLK